MCDLETSRIGAPYIYYISNLRVNNNLLNHIILSIYEINSYTITETSPLILFLGTIVLFPWNRVEHLCGQIGQNSVNLIFQVSATQCNHCALKD